MSRITIRKLVEGDLKYCCLWFFFTRFRRTRLVADRLGVTDQAIRQARHNCGTCLKKPTCLDAVITMKRTPRIIREED